MGNFPNLHRMRAWRLDELQEILEKHQVPCVPTKAWRKRKDEGNQSIWEKKRQCYFGRCFVCFVFISCGWWVYPMVNLPFFTTIWEKMLDGTFFPSAQLQQLQTWWNYKGFSPWNFRPRFLGDPGIMIHWAVATQRFFFMFNPKSRGRGTHLSNEKNPGWLGCIRDYTTQFYREYNKPLWGSRIPIKQPV